MVSIIIPMYNAENYIEKCLESISLQTFRDLEVIIVDDGSTDGSAEIAGRFAKRDSRFIVIKQENHGLVFSRKRGIEKSAGEYVLFVDSDDWISNTAVEEMVKMASEMGDADVVACGALKAYHFADADNSYWCFQNEVNITEEGLYIGQKLEELKHKIFCIENYFAMGILPYLWNKLWKRELIERFVLDAEEVLRVGEDVAIGFMAILKAQSVYVSNRGFYYYRQNGESMMRGKVDEDAEYEDAASLARYLREETAKIGYYDAVSFGIDRFVDNQLYTRAYGILNKREKCDGLFPFTNNIPTNLVIYGAGEFGKAVYRYASLKTKVKAWLDGRAGIYKKMGMPVISVKEYTPEENDVVIIAVFRKKSVDSITKTLIDLGVHTEQIRRIEVTVSCSSKYLLQRT